MAGNETEHGRRGRDFPSRSRERDSKLSPSPTAPAGRGRAPYPSTSHNHRPRSTSAHRAQDPNHERPAHYRHRHHHHQHHHHDSARTQPPPPLADDPAVPSSLNTRRASPSPAPSTSSRYAKRSARDYSPRPPRSYAQRPYSDRAQPARRPQSPGTYPTRRRSRSIESRYSSRQPRYPSERDRYNDRRRYSPPSTREYRHSGHSARGRPANNYASRHSKPPTRSPPRDARRSDSPSDDLISQLATTARPEEAKSSRRRGPSAHSRRSSRSPRPDSRRPYRQDPPRYRESERERDRDRDRDYGRDYDGDYGRSRDYDRGGRRDYHDRRERYRDEREPDAMYGRGGPPRQPIPPRSYVDPRYSQSPQYPPAGPSPPHAQSPYGRTYPPQAAYASYHGSPTHAAYSAAPSPYYQQNYPPPAASPYYQAQQQQPPPPQHFVAQPPMSAYPPQHTYRGQPPSRGYNNSQRPPVPAPAPAPPASRGGRGGHFSNLSWTPSSGSRGGKVVSKRENSISGTETPLAPRSTTDSVDDDDNPFRPPKDLRAEDETEKRKSGISFSIKGMAGRTDPSAPHRPAPLAAPRTRKEIVMRKRLKPKPKLTTDFAASDSVYYRKTGNESVVGSGTYGKVYKAVHVYTGDKVALKKIRMEGERDGFPVTAIREIKLLQSLNHTNVVKLQEVMVERNDCFMIFEYLSHDLTGLLNHPSFVLTEGHKKDLAKQLFEGLDYLHKRGVLHRDIKAANILVSRNGELKLADFGLARFYNKNAKRKQDYTNRVITIWYRSPELLLGETQYGPAVDIWSAACVLVEIFTKHAIFPGDGGEINQLDKIYNVLGTPSRSDWPGIVDLAWYELLRPMHKVPSTFTEKYQERVSTAAFELLSAMFIFDPEKRPTASEVLQHPYFATEEPKAQKVIELKNLEGDWHEFESKALRKEKEREARRRDKENAEKRKLEGPIGDERELKRVKTTDAQA
ncbi:Pkinase-domain-containing protein [Aureobasidium pullulans]|uniref:cyclin-dependent kinase n=2 Tax=Aureobasidium pullulans TaxID=5580 RepID=A0A4S9VKJ1_AURPU|nr:Pkinase-domain-containing protein [Aureobasidium pullulans]THX64119.1 Pkinase-domain-containing protein [Aureobasidium pullulans]THZ52088.1 Pkinase-domain-containing protein [Aureobasidium pullulans]